ncbi:hypothetical protein AN958_00789 [Leucoagaricus sp. SymC.cos]|nr:hypothetical protein AN958_00789 [Leucoagaricus sp. SymC.cos]
MDDNLCATHWSNMINDMTSRMWMANMVCSRELSKYLLALVNALLNTLSPNIVCGYDIGCKFGTTVSHTDLAEKAKAQNFKSIVKGIGLEDLKGCKRFFSRSNALVSSTHYASPFHHKQKIMSFMEHMDKFETSYNLSSFLVNNYCQALKILDDEAALLEGMKNEKIADRQVFYTWLNEEHEYLQELSSEPEDEVLHMDYYQSLVNLKERVYILTLPTSSIDLQIDFNQQRTQSSKGLLECSGRSQAAIDHLEETIPILNSWMSIMPEYQHAADLASYKLCKHIGKALQIRSQSIRTAIDKYNIAAHALHPLHPILIYETVMDYTFLSHFDLL